MRYHFLEFTLDTGARSLARGEKPVRLSPKAFDLLSLLVRERDRVVSRQDLYDHLWPGTFVVEGNLPVLIREIRTAIDDSRHEAITTVHRSGYRFSAPVHAVLDSVAVMPLVNASADPALDSLADGIVDQIINRLALVPHVRVMSRSATVPYKRSAADAHQIGRELSVAAVMFGSLTRKNEQTSVTIELADTADRRVILSRTYVRPDTELGSLPLRIAADVAGHLHAEIDGTIRASILREPTTSAEAYRCHLNARQCLSRFDPMSLHESIVWNGRAVAIDPNFADAYSDLARAYLQLGIYFEAPGEMMPLALKNVRRALDIDATLADAHINLGVLHFIYEWDWDAAERELFMTSELHPKTAEAFSCASHLLESAGRKVNAEHFIRRGLAYDPRSVLLLTELGCNAYAHRQYDTAIREYRAALSFDLHNPVAYWGLGRAYGQKAMYAEALEELGAVEKLNGFAPPIVVSETGYVLGRCGKTVEARDVLDALLQQRDTAFIDPYLIAVVHLGMGFGEEALTWLETAFAQKSGFAVAIHSEPKWDPVRRDPRFTALLDRLGFDS